MSVFILGLTKRLLIILVVAWRPGCERLWKYINNLFLGEGVIYGHEYPVPTSQSIFSFQIEQ